VRNEHPDWFGAEAAYEPLTVKGSKAEHVVAFARGAKVVTVVPRHTLSVGDWSETSVEVPKGRWRNRLTGEVIDGGAVKVSALLARFPVALLTGENDA